MNNDPQEADSKTLKAAYSWILILLGVSVLLLLRLQFFHDQHPDIRIFTEELAFALILAGLFSLTVEKYHREEFRKFVMAERERLKRDVFLYAYGHTVSEQTRQQIKDRITMSFSNRPRKFVTRVCLFPSVFPSVRQEFYPGS